MFKKGKDLVKAKSSSTPQTETPSTEVSLAPASLESLSQDLDTNLDITEKRLTEVGAAYSTARLKAERWSTSLDIARHELFRLKDNISKDAAEMAFQMLKDGEQRLQAIEEHEIAGQEEELKRLQTAKQALSSLKTRLELQRYREKFMHRTVSITAQKDVPEGPDLDSLAAIEREVKTWAHTINAWKELQS